MSIQNPLNEFEGEPMMLHENGRILPYDGALVLAATSARLEQAGIFGLTTCSFDGPTGEWLSTTRDYEQITGLTLISAIPGPIVAEPVNCPMFNKCASCPSKKTN